jgi:hypothetical protein
MRPQRQTIFRDADLGIYGNCLAACIACMLDIDVNEVPNFAQNSTWASDAKEWLAERGLSLVYFDGDATDATMIAYGKTVRGTRHAVLWRNGALLHDPHPSDAGLIAAEELCAIAISDMSRLVAWRTSAAKETAA